MLVTLSLSALAAMAPAQQLSPWKDCGSDWLGCCKLESGKKYPSQPSVKFTDVVEKNYKNESGVVRKGDPFFTIEDIGKALVPETLPNITKRIRGYWKVPVLGTWLKYVDVTKDLCSDGDEALLTNLCPLVPSHGGFDGKVKHGKLGSYVPYGIYKSIESWTSPGPNGPLIGCVDTGEWLYTKPAS